MASVPPASGPEITPRALRAAKREVTRNNPATPTPSTRYSRRPLQHSTAPSQPLPPLLTQPDFGNASAFSPTGNTSGLHLPDESFFSSPDVQGSDYPDEQEAFFQADHTDTLSVPSDFDFDERSSSGGIDDLDIFGSQAAEFTGVPDQTAPPPNTPLPGVTGLPAPYALTSPPPGLPGPVDTSTPVASSFNVNLANQPAEDERTGAQCNGTLDGDTEDEDTYDTPQRQRPGRISKEVHAMIEEFKGKMDNLIAEYSVKTNRTESNLVSLWGTRWGYTRVHRSTWNKYQAHFSKNRVEERARIQNANADCNACFLGFQAHYGKKWKAVLDVYDEMAMVQRANQNESNRSTTFASFAKDLVRFGQKTHIFGFEFAGFLTGSRMHHDQGLAEFVESEGAQGFWNTLPVTSDSVLTFLQNYAFDLVRRTAQDDCARAVQSSHPELFNDAYQFQNNDPSTSQARSNPKSVPALTPSHPPRRNPSPSAVSTTSSVAGRKGVGKNTDEDIVRAYLYEELELQGRSFPVAQMPWTKLKNQIAGQGFILEGWPEEAAFPVTDDPTAPVIVEAATKGKKASQPPRESSDSGRKGKGKKGQSGMRQIGVVGTRAMSAACTNRTLRVVKYKGALSDLKESRVAWITGVRPLDSRLGRRQCFYDGHCHRLRVQDSSPPTPSSSQAARPLSVDETPKPPTSTLVNAPSSSSGTMPAPVPAPPAPATSSSLTPATSSSLAPATSSSLAPATSSSLAPAAASSLAPAAPTSLAPAATTSLAPAATTSLAPAATTSLAPAATTSLAPAATTSLAPAAPTSLAPAATTSLAPAAATSLAPAATTSLAPAAPTSLAPAATTSLAPAATTSLAPATSSFAPATTTSLAPATTTPLAPATTTPLVPAASSLTPREPSFETHSSAPAPPSSTVVPSLQAQRAAASRAALAARRAATASQNPPTPLESAPAPATSTTVPAAATEEHALAPAPPSRPRPRPTGRVKVEPPQSFSHPACNPHPIYRRAPGLSGEISSTTATEGSSSLDAVQTPSVLPPSATIPSDLAQTVLNSPPPAQTGPTDMSPPIAPTATIKRPAENNVDNTETKKPRGTTPATTPAPIPAPYPLPVPHVAQMRHVSPVPQMQLPPMPQMQMSPMGMPMQMQMAPMPGMHHAMTQGYPMYPGMNGPMPNMFGNQMPSDPTPASSMMSEGAYQVPYSYYGSPYTFYPPMPGFQPYHTPSPHPSMSAPSQSSQAPLSEPTPPPNEL